eukprot:CAMPEP_0168527246 /NCGR_PEP_ID=MMETSP0405-20121227/12479_1 /TAXON_ID=498012 /ORGANISM="Trichosphaerium sp, Strain Am-I-7 wt" /LENGTH=132 /DNA_ID=CAMNT_0008550303 /DNA_START=564 /DNA_END=959 /DNA_ORIENTATION=+
MTEAVGPKHTTAILLSLLKTTKFAQNLDKHNQEIPPSVYKKLLVAGQKELAQTELVHDTLEIMDSYLWSQRPPAMGPQIRTVHDTELAGSKIELPFVWNSEMGKESIGSSSAMLNFEYQPLPRYFEEANCHW